MLTQMGSRPTVDGNDVIRSKAKTVTEVLGDHLTKPG
jgi:hypothetical protein